MTTGSSVSFAVAAARIKEPVAFLAKARDGVLLTACDDRNRGVWWAGGATIDTCLEVCGQQWRVLSKADCRNRTARLGRAGENQPIVTQNVTQNVNKAQKYCLLRISAGKAGGI